MILLSNFFKYLLTALFATHTEKLVLEKLDPRAARLTIVGQRTLSSGKIMQEERWYKTKYYFEKIDRKTIDGWLGCGLHPNLRYLIDKNTEKTKSLISISSKTSRRKSIYSGW